MLMAFITKCYCFCDKKNNIDYRLKSSYIEKMEKLLIEKLYAGQITDLEEFQKAVIAAYNQGKLGRTGFRNKSSSEIAIVIGSRIKIDENHRDAISYKEYISRGECIPSNVLKALRKAVSDDQQGDFDNKKIKKEGEVSALRIETEGALINRFLFNESGLGVIRYFERIKQANNEPGLVKEVDKKRVAYFARQYFNQAAENIDSQVRKTTSFFDEIVNDWAVNPQSSLSELPLTLAFQGDLGPGQVAYKILKDIKVKSPSSDSPSNDKNNHPAWDEFLNRLSSKEDFMSFVWSIFDLKNVSRQYVWLEGAGQDGKSVVIKAFSSLLGEALSIGAASEQENNFTTSSYINSRLIVFPDIDKKDTAIGTRSILKQITGGDTVRVEPKGQTAFKADIKAKVICTSNYQPRIGDIAADKSRLVRIKVGESQVKNDPNWLERLISELPEFLSSCKEIYIKKAASGRGDVALSQVTKDLVDECVYRPWHEDFIEANVEFEKESRVEMHELKKQFKKYLRDNNFKNDGEYINAEFHKLLTYMLSIKQCSRKEDKTTGKWIINGCRLRLDANLERGFSKKLGLE